jgi:hypothetical protein
MHDAYAKKRHRVHGNRCFQDPTATHRPTEPVLQYEAFLAALVHAATKLRRPDVPYVSEALRE